MMVRNDRPRDEVVDLGRTVQGAWQKFAFSPAGEFISMPDCPCGLESLAKQLAIPTGLQICRVDDQSIAELRSAYAHAAAAGRMGDAEQQRVGRAGGGRLEAFGHDRRDAATNDYF